MSRCSAPSRVDTTELQHTLITSPPPQTITPDITQTPIRQVTLQVWLPPQIVPSTETTAGRLLQDRLNEFTSRRPGVSLEVRIKSQEGPGGLLDSISTASTAAPQVLPDLVALPRSILETAAIKGFLHPLDGLTSVMDNADWYDFARQLAHVQNSLFGIPFAGDCLILVYRPANIGKPPISLPAAISNAKPFSFPVTDPHSLFPLSLYLSAGGTLQDDQGRPTLDQKILSDVLTLLKQAESADVIPYRHLQYETDNEVWQLYQEKRSDMVITWISMYLNQMLADSTASHLPTFQGEPFTLATGWVWASASPNSEKYLVSVQLAEFLSESAFLSDWTAAAGYLPPRPTSLAAWDDASLITILNDIALSARLYPATDVLVIISPPLSQATLKVLKGESDPQTAAQEAVTSMVKP